MQSSKTDRVFYAKRVKFHRVSFQNLNTRVTPNRVISENFISHAYKNCLHPSKKKPMVAENHTDTTLNSQQAGEFEYSVLASLSGL